MGKDAQGRPLGHADRDQVRGMFLGIAIGDALGVPVETYDWQRIHKEYGRITTYLQNPTHKWSSRKPAGMWSDDTQLTLAVAEGIIEAGSLDLDTQARWHLKLLDEFGDLGLGGSTRDSLTQLRAGTPPTKSGRTDNPKRGMGNAMVMKGAPLGVYLATAPLDGEPKRSWEETARDIVSLAHMTHHTDVGGMSAVAHAYAISLFLLYDEQTVRYLLSETLTGLDEVPDFGPESRSGHDLYNRLVALQYLQASLPALRPESLDALLGGDRFHVGYTLPFCYGMFLRGPGSIETLYDTVSAGGDTDTNASIVGGMLGTMHGTGFFPAHLVDGLAYRERILDTAERLCDRLGITEQ